MEKIEISEKWFNEASEEEVARFILGFNDNQGDHCVDTYKSIFELVSEAEVTFDGKDITEEYLKNSTRSEILDEFYNSLGIGGNDSDMLYFDGEYKKVEWIEQFKYILIKNQFMEVLGYIIAAVVAYLVGQDAVKRGMNPWGWGIFVFLIMIIGLPCYFIFRKPKITQ